MIWRNVLYHGVARELGEHGVEAWLMRLDRVDARRIEAAADGDSFHQGESTCLSLALWWGERRVTLSFPIVPDCVEGIPERVAASIKALSAAASSDGPAQSASDWHEGARSSWKGDWNALADRWRPQLRKSISGTGIGAQQLTLSLERRESFLRDHEGRSRQGARHATRIVISCRGGPQGRGAWTMAVPLDTPEPRELAPYIGRVMRHARLRACRTSPAAGSGPILLQSTASAQVLAIVRASRDLSGGASAAFPAPGGDALRIPPGMMASQRARPRGLTIWHLDEVLSAGSHTPLAMIASGTVVTSNGVRAVSGLRVSIPWRAVERALLDPARRGRSPLAIRLGETDYHVPALSLGESSWAPQ